MMLYPVLIPVSQLMKITVLRLRTIAQPGLGLQIRFGGHTLIMRLKRQKALRVDCPP
jgi:hypothetical protein